MSSRVIVDERERASKIPEYLKTLGIRVDYRMLAVGDYVTFSGCVVERKEAHDFVSSLFSGRLFDQAHRLVEAYGSAVIVVEGDFQAMFEKMPNPRAMWGALSTLTLEYGLNVFFTLDTKQTADLLQTLAKRGKTADVGRPAVYKGFRVRTSEETKLAVLSNLPGIGPKLAKRLLNHFGSLRKVFAASVAELTLVEGIGRVKANKIVEVLEAASEDKKREEQLKLN